MEEGRLKIEDGTKAGAWRLFVAISLPDAVKDEIEKVQREMREVLPGNFMRWTKREQFHLTLKFVGNVAEARVAELSHALRSACVPFPAMRLRAERIGFFPDMRYPRVAWAWVHDEENRLLELQRAVEMSVQSFTSERAEKDFTGHVTLARIQGMKRPQAEILSKFALGMSGRFFGEWSSDKVELIRSELLPSGARYTTVADFPLSGT
jgi:2'-5' RNA ligase